jgi:hypothetical protein
MRLLPLRLALTLPQRDETGDLIQRHEPATAKWKRRLSGSFCSGITSRRAGRGTRSVSFDKGLDQ